MELRAPAEDPSPRAPSPAKKKGGGRTGSLYDDKLKEEKRRALKERRKSMTLREIVYTTMDDPDFSGLGKFWSLAMMVIILFSTLAFILESEVCQSTTCVSTAGILPFEASMFFYVSEWVCVVIFTVDYVLRLTCAPRAAQRAPPPRRRAAAAAAAPRAPTHLPLAERVRARASGRWKAWAGR